jgi:hypothetical protein
MTARHWRRAAGAGLATLCLLGTGAAVAAGTPPSPSSSPPKQRLTQSQWAAYQKANTAFVARTAKTVATFRRCRSLQTTGRHANALAVCLGNAPKLEIAVTKTLSNLLNTFEGKTTGACAKSLAQYQGALFFWNTSVTAVDRAVHSAVSQVAAVQTQAQQAVFASQRVTADAKIFVGACAPVRHT